MHVSIANGTERDTPANGILQTDARWGLARRIAESKTFAKSERLSHLLLYVCEQYILGHADELTERKYRLRRIWTKR